MKKRALRTPDPPHFLSGWKEIATFLGKGVRTVQRYERELRLPVRRPAGKSRGSVIAVVAELEGWVKASAIREMFQLRNTQQDYRDSTQELRSGVSELAKLREQMTMLRFELRHSVTRLRDSVRLLRGELDQRGSKHPSQILSQDEHDLLDRAAADVMVAPIRYPKAS